jgi:hypothetical protein
MPQPTPAGEGINWLDDSQTAPGAAVSRPSPATRPAPAPAAAKPAPKPATSKPASAPPKTSPTPQPAYAQSQGAEEKSGIPGWVMIAGVLVLVGIIVAIILTRKH